MTWKEQKAYLDRRAAVLGTQMDNAIKACDANAFFAAYNKTFYCMGARRRHQYYVRMLEMRLSTEEPERW